MARDEIPSPGEVDEGPSGFDQARRFGPVIILAVVAILFAAQNTDEAHFEFLSFDFRWPLWVMLLLFAGIGAAISWFLGVRRRRRRDD